MTPDDLDDMALLLGDPEVMTYYFARHMLGATRLIAIIHPDNRPSQRVAEKIGLRPERCTAVHGGRDAIIYAAALDEG